MLLASVAKNKSPGISSSNALLAQRLRASSTALIRLTLNQCRLLLSNAMKRPKKAACTSQKNASTEFCTKQKYDTDCAQAFCGLVQQQGGIPTVGQNNRHETQEIKSVFQTARHEDFGHIPRAHTLTF